MNKSEKSTVKNSIKSKMNLAFVIGTAAELIKVFPIYQLAEENGWSIKFICTGQSGSNLMMQFKDFQISESLIQVVEENSKDLQNSRQALLWFLKGLFTSKSKLKSLFNGPPDWIVVHGDTLSTLLGSIWARRLGLRLAHVEAGLRSHSLLQPFPEEICRRWVGRLVHLHFAPDALAKKNLSEYGDRVYETHGNTLKDLITDQKLFPSPTSDSKYCLVNVHRFENLNHSSRWDVIIKTVLRAAHQCRVLFVMHPQTEAKIEADYALKLALQSANIELLPRLPMSEFIQKLKGAEFLISDGGSNQEECSYLGVPCLILRDKTERQEGLDRNCVLSQFNPYLIEAFLDNPSRYRTPPMQDTLSPSQIILNTLEENHVLNV